MAGLLAATAGASGKPVADWNAAPLDATDPALHAHGASAERSGMADDHYGLDLASLRGPYPRPYAGHVEPTMATGTQLLALYPAHAAPVMSAMARDVSATPGADDHGQGIFAGTGNEAVMHLASAASNERVALAGEFCCDDAPLRIQRSYLVMESRVHPGSGIVAGLTEPGALLLLTFLFAASGFGLRSMLRHR